jgi:hypothetical protein
MPSPGANRDPLSFCRQVTLFFDRFLAQMANNGGVWAEP